MTQALSGRGLTTDAPASEQAFRAVQRVEHAQRRVRAAQLSAADSFNKSADSQERLAKVYEQASELGDAADREERQERAARHHMKAEDDHWTARRLRLMASR
jgi:hypothetical protein